MDGDLQNVPEEIPRFLEKIEEGFDLVSGWRVNRKDILCRRVLSRISNWLISIRTGVVLHDYGCAFVAVKKELVTKLRSYKMGARFIKPTLAKIADSVVEIKIMHYPRKRGVSKYSLVKIINSGIDFLCNFTLDVKNKEPFSYAVEEVVDNKS